MIAFNSVGRTIVFGAVAAMAYLPWTMTLGPNVGYGNAQSLYLFAVMVTYVAGLCPGRSRSTTSAVGAFIAGLVAAAAAHTTTELVIGFAIILGVARSAILYPAQPGRAVARELLLLVGGLVFARFLAGSAASSTPMVVWGFFLIQSCFFLVVDAKPARAAEPDPFEEARRRATALLDAS